MISKINHRNISKVGAVIPNFNKSLERLVRHHLGVISQNRFMGIPTSANAFALYKISTNMFNVFRIYGNQMGIKEIVDYFKELNEMYNEKRSIIFQVPLNDREILNHFKNIKGFNFKLGKNEIVLINPCLVLTENQL